MKRVVAGLLLGAENRVEKDDDDEIDVDTAAPAIRFETAGVNAIATLVVDNKIDDNITLLIFISTFIINKRGNEVLLLMCSYDLFAGKEYKIPKGKRYDNQEVMYKFFIVYDED